MASYVKDVRTVLLLSIVGFIAGVGVQSCLAWFLMPVGRGQYAVCVIVFASLLSLLSTIGQEMANVYYVAAKKITLSQVMTQSLVVGSLASIVACTVGYFLTMTALPFLNKAPVSLFRISLFCIPAMVFNLYFSRIFLGMGQVSTFKYLTLSVQVFNVLGLAVAGALGRLDVGAAILIQAGANFASASIAALLLIYRHGCRIVRLDFGVLLRSLGYGLRYCFGKIATLVNVQISTIVLSFYRVGVSELGLFSAAVALTSKIHILAEAVQVAALPRSAADSRGQREMIAQSIRICFILSFVAGLVVFVLSKPIISTFLSRRFLPVLVPLWILLPGTVARTISKILPAYFAGINRPQITSLIMVVSIATNLILISILLPIWGLAGVALANSIGYVLEALLMGLAFHYYSGICLWHLVRFTKEDWYVLVQTWKRFGVHLPSAG